MPTSEQTAELYWRDKRVIQVNGAAYADFPWISGTIELIDLTILPSGVRDALFWLADMAESDEFEDPPFDPELLEHWFMRSSDGTTSEICTPLIDMESGIVSWR